jgi:hypothetical protein
MFTKIWSIYKNTFDLESYFVYLHCENNNLNNILSFQFDIEGPIEYHYTNMYYSINS